MGLQEHREASKGQGLCRTLVYTHLGPNLLIGAAQKISPRTELGPSLGNKGLPSPSVSLSYLTLEAPPPGLLAGGPGKRSGGAQAARRRSSAGRGPGRGVRLGPSAEARAGRPRPDLAHLGREHGQTRRLSPRGHPAWRRGRGRRAGRARGAGLGARRGLRPSRQGTATGCAGSGSRRLDRARAVGRAEVSSGARGCWAPRGEKGDEVAVLSCAVG
nr:uncharacterized protein LOC118972254 [Manis javanica]